MNRFRVIALMLLLSVLVSGCGRQSYTNGGASSYTSRRSLSSTTPETQSSNSGVEAEAGAVVISTRAHLLGRPSRSAGIVLEARKGEGLRLLEGKPTGPWYKVRHTASGKEGWVHGNAIKLTAPAPAPPAEALADTNAGTTANRSGGGGGTASYSGDTYINSFGEEVPRPRRSTSVPAGASARCRDGTYSFSRSRRGTCSHHGGVAQWL
jgi:hypothetical protein